jgi:hypothetical protein
VWGYFCLSAHEETLQGLALRHPDFRALFVRSCILVEKALQEEWFVAKGGVLEMGLDMTTLTLDQATANTWGVLIR